MNAQNAPQVTTPTTFVSTAAPLSEGTTLATAGSAISTTVSTDAVAVEGASAGQGSNGGYKFESTRNRPNANQEAQPESVRLFTILYPSGLAKRKS